MAMVDGELKRKNQEITLSLFTLAKKKGVTFHLGEKVNQILLDKVMAIGVKTEKKILKSDITLSNMDVFPTYKNLLKNTKPPYRILSQERSSSAVIFYWGIQQKFDQLDLHNIFFSSDYKAEFEAIFNQNIISDDFTVYVYITSKDIPTDAPQGGDYWFVMINTAADHGQDWEKIKNQLRKKTISKLNRILKTNLNPLIKVVEVLSPPLIQKKTSSLIVNS